MYIVGIEIEISVKTKDVKQLEHRSSRMRKGGSVLISRILIITLVVMTLAACSGSPPPQATAVPAATLAPQATSAAPAATAVVAPTASEVISPTSVTEVISPTVAASGGEAISPTVAAPTSEVISPTVPSGPTAEPQPVISETGSAGTFIQFGDTLNRDKKAAGTDQNITEGSLFAGAQYITWVTWAEKSGNTQQIFVSRQNGSAFEPVGASLNIHANVVAEKPSIDFAGQDRTVPWATWYEPSPGFGGAKQVFASRFNKDSGLWVPSGQDRGGNEPSLNIHTNKDAEDPVVVGGTANPANSPTPWVCWQEDSAHSNSVQIFVSRAVKDDTGLGGFKWVPVGVNRGGTAQDAEPSLNVDFAHSDGEHCWIVFAGKNNAVPWVVWQERSGGKSTKIFAARAIADAQAPGGFHWEFVPKCAGVQDSDKCVLNLNPDEDATDPFMTAGSLSGGDTAPWLTWTEVAENGKTQVLVFHLDPATGSKFLQVGASLNVNPNADAENPSITFLGNVPYVAWSEAVGNVKRVFVRHLTGDAKTGTWTLDAPQGGLGVDKTQDASAPIIRAKGGKGVEFIFRQGDPDNSASQIIVCTNAPFAAFMQRVAGFAAPLLQAKACQ